MSQYIVSARKYRPDSFGTLLGQDNIARTLSNSIKRGQLAHAYLFCGPRGVGKTTTARIFAKMINCAHPGPDMEPCGTCESCVSFQEGRSYCIHELDAASNNGVDDIKALIDKVQVPPQVGKYSVYIIDEVHMLTQSAFNAFLKTLEEPPAHVIFILATTEKHKILPTILSRCQIYDFERMTIRNTVDHLKHVAEQEGITYEEQALAVIAEKADGGMRDALSIFDQAASFCQGNITYDKVIEDLNVLDSENYFQIVDLSIINKVSDIMVLLNNIINKGFDGGLLIQGLAKHVRNVMMAKDPQTLPLLEVSDQQRQRYAEQAKKCDTRFLYQALKLMNQCDINYRQSSNKRLLVELTLIEVAQITQPEDGASAGRRPRRLKSLFKQLIQQSQPKKAAPQVAQAKTAASPVAAKANAPVASGNPPTSGNTGNTRASGSPSAPKMKLNNIGFSWGSLLQKDKPSKMNVIPGTVAGSREEQTDAVFSQEDLELQWMSMCNRMPQELSGIATRMKNMNPVIMDFPKLQVTVDNTLIQQQMEDFKGRIVKTLINCLHNVGITLEIVVAEQTDRPKLLTRREQFEAMRKINPAIEKLQQDFDLELA